MRETPVLPNDLEALKAMAGAALRDREVALREQARQQRRCEELELELLLLNQKLEWYRRRLYGPRGDQLRTAAELGQMLLGFAEALEQRPVNPEDVPAGAPPAPPQQQRRVGRRGGRRNLARLENLPERKIVHELRPAERACPGCGAERREIGCEERWQLEYVPGHFERLHHLRKKYACPACEQAGGSPAMATAARPPEAIERGMAGPGLLAYVVTSKFADYLPLYRLEDIFARIGCEVSRATLSVWCGDVADLVEPLYEHMARRVRRAHVVGTDDTPMPMLDPGGGRTHTARMWIYRGDPTQPYNVFAFTRSRKRDGPAGFLADYRQVLVADAYGGYDGVVAGNQITRAGCWAHVRRKFVEAEASAPALAREAVERVRQLYQIEQQASGADAEARLRLRQQQSAPLLEALHRRLLAWQCELLPKHPFAAAINYALHQWDTLTVFTRDGEVPIDNNACEREMKRVVLNRKNSLFVGNPRGGRTAAILASLTSTCRRHQIDPQLYLTQLLVNLPGWPVCDLDAWLPDQWLIRQQNRTPQPPGPPC